MHRRVAHAVCVAALVAILIAAAVEAKSRTMAWPFPAPPAPRPFDDDVVQMVANMTLKEKVGQMVQLDLSYILRTDSPAIDVDKLNSVIDNYFVGSFLNSPTSGGWWGNTANLNPSQWIDIINTIQTASTTRGNMIPMIYGLDSVHGANYINGATLFPQQLAAAATFNRDIVTKMGAVTAKDTRAVGIPWSFAPILGIAVQPAWPRVYETFGEDPYLASEMGVAIIRGMQGYPTNISDPTKVAACAKHFVGYTNPRSGTDRSPGWIPDRMLWQYFVPSFRAAIQRGNVRTSMESYNEINGVPVASSSLYLKQLLREELGFDGMMVTDYQEIEDLHDFHRIADSQQEAVRISMEDTTIDMSMVPLDTSFADYLVGLVQSGDIPEDRVTTSASRIIQLKKDLGLFTNAFPDKDSQLLKTIGSAEDRQVATDACRESATLLKNDGNLLPINPAALPNKKILVAGPSCDSLTFQTGGWSVHWQGAQGDWEFPYGTTVLGGLNALVNGSATITHIAGCDINGNTTPDQLQSLTTAAQQSDVAIVCIGEVNYAERMGDIGDLRIPQGQQDVVNAISSTNIPIALVLLEGRPRILNGIADKARSVVHGFLPGPDGGTCLAEILLGVTNPSGRLPISYPNEANDLPVQYYHKFNEQPVNFQWEFGSGMSYTSFAYSNLRLNASTVAPGDYVQVTVNVANTGSRDGKEAVLLFLTDDYRRVTPEVRMLKGFEKIGPLAPGASQDVSFILTTDDLAYYGVDMTRVIEEGSFTVAVGGQTAQFTLAFPN